jgi:large subunit ribosomal protein L35Ae
MKAIIKNFRSARHHQYDNQMVIYPEGMESKDKAQALVGKKVIFKTETGKEIAGKVSSPHGSRGAVRAIFEKGMPGQSIGKPVEIQ